VVSLSLQLLAVPFLLLIMNRAPSLGQESSGSSN
jgi:hypothetical protein